MRSSITRQLAEALAAARAQTDLTQEQVARILDVDSSTVRKWEQARNTPPIHRIPELEDLYELPRGWIFGAAGLIADVSEWPIEELIATDQRIPAQFRKAVADVYRGYINYPHADNDDDS